MRVAIIGMAGRFPGAPDLAAFWRMLREGRDGVGPVPEGRWDHAGIVDAEHEIPAVGCFLDDVELFDAAFFGISPREAAVLDPQQSLVLEVGWQALEDADVRAADLRGTRTGVYVGAMWHDHELRRKDQGRSATPHSIVGNSADVIAGRLSYVLGVTGPSIAVGTGCSSSLVALHLAAQALAAGEIDTALVAGANVMLDPDVTIGLTHFGGLSPTGRCRPFGNGADGYVRGEGAVAVHLKPLDAALRDGDRIRAVVEASGVNNDGGGSSLVTPDGTAQESLLRRVYHPDGPAADRLAYVEAHGTGTARGDAAEAGSLGRAVGRPARPLPIGSVKANIGHLEGVAGLAGLAKAVLALEHGVVPASLNADEPNPAIDFTGLGLRVARSPVVLPAGPDVLVGVDSFGWGGTNAHVVLARPPAPAAATDTGPPVTGPVLVPVSAHDDAALDARVAGVTALIDGGSDVAEVAAALAWNRDQFVERAALLVDATGRTTLRGRARDAGRVAFVFPGQGAQWAGMGAALLGHDDAFTASIDRCAAALAPVVGWDLRELLAGGTDGGWLRRVDMVQPALWAMSVSLAAVWRTAGVRPDVVIGHSQGEIAAATVAGALSVEDGARLVGRRSALLRRIAGHGRMLAVDLDRDDALRALRGFEDAVSLAVHNGPRSCVLAGDTDSVLLLREILETDGVFCRLVDVDYASHSPQVDALLPAVTAELADLVPRAGSVPMLSTVRVEPVDGACLDAAYWADNLRRGVRFGETVEAAVRDGVTHLIEVSPHPGLGPAMTQIVDGQDGPAAVLPTLRRGEGTPGDLRRALAGGWVAGLPALGPRPRRRPRVPLPAYPWQRRRHLPADAGRGPARPGRLAVRLEPSPAGGAWTGVTDLSTRAFPWLGDHRVGDAVLFPAGGHVALVEDAVGGLDDPPDRLVLHDVVFPAALAVPEHAVRLAVTWRPAGEGAGTVAVASRDAGGTAWSEHCRARVARRGEPGTGPAPSFPGHLLGAEECSAEEFRRRCAARDLHYGPAFHVVTSVRAEPVPPDAGPGPGPAEVLARIDTPRAGGRTAGWDAVLQAALLLVTADGPVVPTRLDRLETAGPAAGVSWVHAVRRAGPDGERCDLVVFDEERVPVGRVDGLVLSPVPGARPAVADERTFGLHLREATAPAAGADLVRVVCGPGAENVRRVARVLPGADAVIVGERPLPVCDTLVFVAPCGVAEQRAGLVALAEVVAGCLRGAVPARLTVVTGTALAAPDGSGVEPGAALYAGFAAVLRTEHPSLHVRLVDIDAVTDALAAELTSDDDEDVVVLRGGRRWVGRRERGTGSADRPPPWRTGGDGGAYRVAPVRPGRLDSLARFPVARRGAGPGEVEIEVEAAALNFIDVMKAMDVYPDTASGTEGLGLECAGTVVAVGAGVGHVGIGDAVVGCGAGVLGSHATVDARHVVPVPPGLDPARAVTLPIATATAWYALADVARVRACESVLVHSAAGAVGLAAVAVARRLGAEVVATAGTEAKRAHLRELGVRHVLDSRDVDAWSRGVRTATDGRGVDVVLNSLAGPAVPAGLDVLADDGRFVELGKRDIWAGTPLDPAAFRRAVSFSAVDLAGMRRRAPDRFAALLDEVWRQVAAGTPAPLPARELPFGECERAFRTLAGGEHIGKVVLTGPRDGGAVHPDHRVRAGCTYLITGGHGALGLSLAEFLVAAGAGSVALLSRSAPDPSAVRRIGALRERGALVTSWQCDVGDEAELARVLGAVRADLPELRGVLHAAGVLSDATAAAVTADQVERVLRPKFDGALLLDRLTTGDALDLFVVFSSVAAFVGTPGQAVYAAANAGVDALVQRRRRKGLPGLSVQWGTVADVGLATDGALRGTRLADRGIGPLAVADCWPALWRLLDEGAEVVCFAALDPHRWVQTNPAVAALPSWQPLLATEPGVVGPRAADGLRRMPGEARRTAVEHMVRRDVAAVLMIEETVLERYRDAALSGMGLDSLMTIELRNRLESSFGLRLSPTLLWQHGNVAALGSALDAMVGADAPAAP